MKRFCLLLLLAVLPLAGWAQSDFTIPVNDLETDFGGHFSLTLDKKLARGLHLTADGEARLRNDFTTLGRWHAGVGMTYKVNSFLKVGAGYQFIERLNSDAAWIPRHRVYIDARGMLRTYYWHFSLKERFQYTHRDPSGMNTFQNNPNSLTLKSRVKAEYVGFGDVSPYVFVEGRLVFNDPACKATWNASAGTYSYYEFLGYTDTYFNRVRGAVGLAWKLSPYHALDFALLGDYNYDKEIDTNAEGTRLKSIAFDRSFRLNVRVGYTFSF